MPTKPRMISRGGAAGGVSASTSIASAFLGGVGGVGGMGATGAIGGIGAIGGVGDSDDPGGTGDGWNWWDDAEIDVDALVPASAAARRATPALVVDAAHHRDRAHIDDPVHGGIDDRTAHHVEDIDRDFLAGAGFGSPEVQLGATHDGGDAGTAKVRPGGPSVAAEHGEDGRRLRRFRRRLPPLEDARADETGNQEQEDGAPGHGTAHLAGVAARCLDDDAEPRE